MASPETIYVDDTTVGCDGGGGAQGHPRVFLSLASEGHIDCPYCGQRFAARAPSGEAGAAGDPDGDGDGNGNGG